jgi:V8-like Glu-specific endopeptidase
MPSTIFTAFAYPWHEPEATELFQTLYKVVPRPSRALLIAASVGMETGMINPDQSPYDLWQQILNQSSPAVKTKLLVEKLREDPGLAAAHPLFDALLNQQQVAVDREPAAPDGRPSFRVASDDVSEAEALLFLDDLTIPAGRLPWLIKVLGKIYAVSPSVCRIEVALNNAHKSGTGFRIAPNLLLTNWHVLSFDGATPSSVAAEFFFDTNEQGQATQAQLFACDPNTIRTNRTDDWGVVSTILGLPDSVPVLDLATCSADPITNTPAFILQHPVGGRKRVAFVRNQITFVNHQVVQYVTDTQVGSSGAPVFNENGKVIAIHHAGGRPQEVAGKQALKKNEGIRISQVIAGLQAGGIF